MTLRTDGGSLLIDSGSLANSADCCCDVVGECECYNGTSVVSKPDVTFTLGALGAAQPLNTNLAFPFALCPAGSVPSGFAGDYVLSCGEIYQELFYGFICTDSGLDYYYVISLTITYQPNADDTQLNGLGVDILSRVCRTTTGVTPAGANCRVLPTALGGPSLFDWDNTIVAGTCDTFGTPSSSGANGSLAYNYVDVTGVTVSVSA